MLQKIKSLIQESKSIVVFSGVNLLRESGLTCPWAEERAYEIEEIYGYSPEEIISYDFFRRKKEIFYRFYKEVVLDMEKIQPTQAHHAIARLEKQGKLNHVITRDIFGQYQMAGVSRVIELFGTIHTNICPKCGREYSLDYVYRSLGVPICGKCKAVLRPAFSFFGESMDNNKISKSAEVVSKADMVIIAGTTMDSNLTRSLLKYFSGDRVILINDEPNYGDDLANCVLYGKCGDILPQIISE